VLREAVFLVSLFGINNRRRRLPRPTLRPTLKIIKQEKGHLPCRTTKTNLQPLEHGKDPAQADDRCSSENITGTPKAPAGKRIHERRPAPQVSKGSPVPDETPSPRFRLIENNDGRAPASFLDGG